MEESQTRAPSLGVAAGVLVFGIAVAVQVIAAATLPKPTTTQLLGYGVLPLTIAVLLVLPVRPSRWPVSTQRARNVGIGWLIVGLPWPAWLFASQLTLAAAVVAGPLALIGAGVAYLRAR